MKGINVRSHDQWDANATHIIVSCNRSRYKMYNHGGELLFTGDCLTHGVNGPSRSVQGGDTPLGTYLIDATYDDYADWVPYSDTYLQYGWRFFDLYDLQGQERNVGRAGVGIHGGGSNCGWPAAWEPEQPLYPTLGCIRVHNKDTTLILERTKLGAVFVTVQE